MKKDVLSGRSVYMSALRQELIARNCTYASLNLLPHVTSYGDPPVVFYPQSECGRHHGNFISASYRAILRRPQWRRRLQKVHSQGRRSLPAKDGLWRELDSSLSSDALLMNIFCYPGVTRRMEVCRTLGLESGSLPEFGFMPRVPLETLTKPLRDQLSGREGQFREQTEEMSCGLPPVSRALISKHKLKRKLNDSGTGAEAQNFAEIGSADVADGIVPIRMIQ